MFGLQRSFSGGTFFGRLEGDIQYPVESFSIPTRVTIPLQQGFGEPTLPIVKIGDEVQAGQMIGAGEQLCSPVHATINGRITAFEEVADSKGNKVAGVVIEGEDSSDFIRLSKFSPRFEKKKPADIRALIYRSGAAALGEKGIPTQFKSSSISLENVSGVVMTALNSIPFSLKNEVFLKPRLHQFLTGLSILHFALENKPVYVVINSEDEGIVTFLKFHQKEHPWLKILPTKPKYPQEHKALLWDSVFKGASKKKKKEAVEGAVSLDVTDVIHVYEAVVEGYPVIDQFIALGGTGFVRNAPLRARIGTSFHDIVMSQTKREQKLRLIEGNFLTEPILTEFNFPVTKTSRRLIALIESRDNQIHSSFIQRTKKELAPFLNRFFLTLNKK